MQYEIDYANGHLSGPSTLIDMTALANWRKHELHYWGATLSPKLNVWILEYSPLNENGRAGPSDLYYVKRTAGRWGEPRRLAGDVNMTGSTENFVTFGTTGEDIYFVRDFSAYYRVSPHEALNPD